MAKDDIVFSLRVKRHLKEQLEALAVADGRSLNNYISRILQAHVAPVAKVGREK